MPSMSHHGVAPTIDPTAFVAGGAWLVGDVEVGRLASIWFNAVLRGDINLIRVGARSNVQDGCVVHVTTELPALIGEDVTVGHKAMIHGCTIGNASLIGMNAVVLDNAHVGDYAIVAAGAVVKENFVVPDGTLVAGVPARVVREITEDERASLLASAEHYVEYARSYNV